MAGMCLTVATVSATVAPMTATVVVTLVAMLFVGAMAMVVTVVVAVGRNDTTAQHQRCGNRGEEQGNFFHGRNLG